MGLFDGIQRRQLEKKHAAEEAAYTESYAKYQEALKTVDECIEIVTQCNAGQFHQVFTDTSNYGFNLESTETVMAQIQNCAYLENVKSPSTWNGGYGGVTFELFKGVRTNVGRTRGQLIPGKDQIQMTDKGVCLITDQRIMFNGAHRQHTWPFKKIMAIQHMSDGSIISTTGVGKPAGIGYGETAAATIQFRIELGSAIVMGRLPQFLQQLQQEKDNLQSNMPVPPPPLPSA